MLALALAAPSLRADDQITLVDGTVVNGTIASLSGTQVLVQVMNSRGTGTNTFASQIGVDA